MTFGEIRTRAAALAELGGFTSAANAPDWGRLVNLAYEEFVIQTGCNREEDTETTVASQALYTLTGPTWGTIDDLYVDGEALHLTSEEDVRRRDPLWLEADAGTPLYYWMPRARTLRLHPKPDTGSLVIRLYGVRALDDLVHDDDVPGIEYLDHESLAQRAAWLAQEPWARGEEMQALQVRVDEYLTQLRRRRADRHARAFLGASRYVAPIAAERVEA